MSGARIADHIDVANAEPCSQASPADLTYRFAPTWARHVVVWPTALAIPAAVLAIPTDRVLNFVVLSLLLGPMIWLEHRILSATVTVSTSAIVTRNIFSTQRAVWDEIRDVEFRAYGPCNLRLKTGRTVGLFALQQANWRQMSNRPRPKLVAAIDDLNVRVQTYDDEHGLPTGYPRVMDPTTPSV